MNLPVFGGIKKAEEAVTRIVRNNLPNFSALITV
jgi:hypothetical protein